MSIPDQARQRLNPRQLVVGLKAVGEQTRLRIVVLLAASELNVKDLTQILGQSQPRISRHLKLLVEAGLVERAREGSWVYFCISDRTETGRMALQLVAELDLSDPELKRDRERADALRREREASAQAYFQAHAADWDRIRALHVAEHAVEREIRSALGAGPFEYLIDIGTGTGRMLELMADRYKRALGIDASQAMLAYARANLQRQGLGKAQVRHGDLYNLSLPDGAADAVVMHQVLHFLSDPAAAVREAARLLAPGGRLLIVDFAPHELEFLRESHAHERLGFAPAQVEQWLADAGLEPPSVRHLPPPKGADANMLTVSIWQARRSSQSASSTRQDARTLEEIP
jgi:ArsR family transcriptional regulator